MALDILNKAGSVIYTWIAILGIVIGGIYSIFSAHDSVSDNEQDIIKTNLRIDAQEDDLKEDIELWGLRSDRRYKRLLEQNKEFIKLGITLDNRVRELEVKLSELKGRYDEGKN